MSDLPDGYTRVSGAEKFAPKQSSYEKLAAQVKLTKFGDMYRVSLGSHIVYSCTQATMDLYDSTDGKVPPAVAMQVIERAMDIMRMPADALIYVHKSMSDPHGQPVPAADTIKELLAMVAE